jgi:hypothetical protein
VRQLEAAVRLRNSALYMLAPANATSTLPLSGLLQTDGGPDIKSSIFPAVPLDPHAYNYAKDPGTPQSASELFVSTSDQVQRWGPSVLKFMADHGVQ